MESGMIYANICTKGYIWDFTGIKILSINITHIPYCQRGVSLSLKILLTISKVCDDKEVVRQEKRINLKTISDSRKKNKLRLSDMRIILENQKKCPSEKTKQMAALPCYQSHLYYTRSFGS